MRLHVVGSEPARHVIASKLALHEHMAQRAVGWFVLCVHEYGYGGIRVCVFVFMCVCLFPVCIHVCCNQIGTILCSSGTRRKHMPYIYAVAAAAANATHPLHKLCDECAA